MEAHEILAGRLLDLLVADLLGERMGFREHLPCAQVSGLEEGPAQELALLPQDHRQVVVEHRRQQPRIHQIEAREAREPPEVGP